MYLKEEFVWHSIRSRSGITAVQGGKDWRQRVVDVW